LTAVTEIQYFLIIIRSEGIVKESNIASFCPAKSAAEEQDKAFFTSEFIANRFKQALAAVGPITRINIHMFAMQAVGTMISTGSASWWNFSTAV